MTPERAQELLDHITVMRDGWVMKTIECSNIQKHMTDEEVKYVVTCIHEFFKSCKILE